MIPCIIITKAFGIHLIQLLQAIISVQVNFKTCQNDNIHLYCSAPKTGFRDLGKTIWGPYWDHVLGYWKQSLDKPESLFFLRYEELTNNTLLSSSCMGKPFSRDEERNKLRDTERIVKLCSFEN